MKYFIYSISTEDKLLGTYIGSTENFNLRQSLHRSCANCGNNQHLYSVINNNGGFNNWKMNIVEEIETDNKKDVYEREQYWINQTEYKLNKRNATFNLNDYMIKWYGKHKDNILEKKKEYYKINREKRLAYQKNYYTKKKSNDIVNDCENNEITGKDKTF